MSDRRQNRRVNTPREIFARIKATLPARVLDISCDGMQVELASPLKPSAACDVALPGPDGELKLRAMITRCRASVMGRRAGDERQLWYRAGLSFIGLSDEVRQALEDMVVDFALSESPSAASDGASAAVGHPVKIRVDQNRVARRKPRGQRKPPGSTKSRPQ